MTAAVPLDPLIVEHLAAHGPLVQIWAHEADLGTDGVSAAGQARRVEAAPLDLFRLLGLLNSAEARALMLFAHHMRRVEGPHGTQMVVDGFGEKWLREQGMSTGEARRAASSLKSRGVTVEQDTGHGVVLPKGHRRRVALADRVCGIPSQPGVPLGVGRGRRGKTEAGSAASSAQVTASFTVPENGPDQAVDNFQTPTFRDPETGTPEPVDNPTFTVPESGDPATEALAAKPQVSGSFSFPVAGTTSSSRREVSNYPCTTPTGEIEFASLLAFARDGRLRSALRRHQQTLVADLAGAIKRLPQGDRRVQRASGVLSLLGQPVTEDPITAAVAMALGLLLVEDQAMDEHGRGLIALLRARGVKVPADSPVVPLNVALATALIAATDFDQKRPGGWLYSALTGSAKFRNDGAVAEFLATLMRSTTSLPLDEPGGYGAADLDNEAYRARLEQARQIIWAVYADARDDATWEQYVVPNMNRHQRIFDLAEEVLSRQAHGGGAPQARARAAF